MSTAGSSAPAPRDLRCAVVLSADEQECRTWAAGSATSVPFAPQFPSPRVERVLPGHLVAIATSPRGAAFVVWRWYDAVVLEDGPQSVRLWEPAHGEVRARPRPSYGRQQPGSRAYCSSGLPGADWWVAGSVADHPEAADVELDVVRQLYTESGMWAEVFGSTTGPPPAPSPAG